MAKFYSYSENRIITLRCSCGAEFTGFKSHSHKFISSHRPCFLSTGVKMDLKVGVLYTPAPRDPMESDVDQGPQEIEWADARAIRAAMAVSQ